MYQTFVMDIYKEFNKCFLKLILVSIFKSIIVKFYLNFIIIQLITGFFMIYDLESNNFNIVFNLLVLFSEYITQ